MPQLILSLRFALAANEIPESECSNTLAQLLNH